ncbi:adenosylcobinamide-phosphate synthase CbiB [Allohahella marinimesophila]|uniref:Cobalamin biosynthesis protein CobD n=1 Tax=Allohahella marinimesophila TaxID=1054972 RepID=A0ABP7P037_9GAMM
MLSGFIISVLVCLTAVALDHWLGEPRRFHPLVGFGSAANWLERRLNPASHAEPKALRQPLLMGVLAVATLLAPLMLVAVLAVLLLPAHILVMTDVIVLWLTLSLRGLREHAMAVAEPLEAGNLPVARQQLARIVSRQTDSLDESAVASAATESVLENGADAVFASLFWFLVAGIPGVVLHRAVNTLDAMWGYRNERFLLYGRCAARLDDGLNWIPARLTALTYAVLGNTATALTAWREQAPAWDSLNAGPVMAAGAGALGVSLGGPAPYATGLKQRPVLGKGPRPDAGTVLAAIRLLERGVALWLITLAVAALMAYLQSGGA